MKREIYLISFTTLIFISTQIDCLAQNKLFNKQIIDGQVKAVEMPNVVYKDSKFNNQQKYANMDTLLWMDFESDSVIPDQNHGGDWFNFDFDGIKPANYTIDQKDWFIVDSVFVQDLATGDTIDITRMGLSASWLEGLANGNRNTLITPPIAVSQPGAILRFSTMVAQGPQWADGYTIKVDDIGDPFSATADTLVQNKQYGGSGDGPVWNSSFNWSAIPGDTLHTAYNYDNTLATFTDSGNATVALETWEFSLDAYVGQTIYVNFWHDSDDDNAILLDDISIMQPQASGLSNENRTYSKLYPNPGNGLITFEFISNKNSDDAIEIFNLEGKLISRIQVENDGFGIQKVQIDASAFEKSIYLIKYFNGMDQISKKLYIE